MDGAHLAHRPLDRTAPRGDRPAERNGVLHVDIIIIARGGEGSFVVDMCGGLRMERPRGRQTNLIPD